MQVASRQEDHALRKRFRTGEKSSKKYCGFLIASIDFSAFRPNSHCSNTASIRKSRDAETVLGHASMNRAKVFKVSTVRWIAISHWELRLTLSSSSSLPSKAFRGHASYIPTTNHGFDDLNGSKNYINIRDYSNFTSRLGKTSTNT